MNIFEKLGINQSVALKKATSLKPSEAHLYWCIKKEDLKKLNNDYLQMLEALIGVLQIQYKNFIKCSIYNIPEDNIQNIQYIVEKLTDKKICEIMELLK